ALERGKVARRSGSACLALVSFVNILEDLGEWAVFVVADHGRNFLQAAGLAEGAHETAAGIGSPAEGAHLAEDDGPGIEAGDEQDNEYGHGNVADVAEHLHEGVCAVSHAAFAGGGSVILQQK